MIIITPQILKSATGAQKCRIMKMIIRGEAKYDATEAI
jgi:hypothetical protein